MTRNLIKETAVFKVINETLDGKGFICSKSGEIFVRKVHGVNHVISLDPSNHDKQEFDVSFGIWADELIDETVKYTDHVDEWAYYSSSLYAHPLSPDDPLRSPYRWGEADKVTELSVLKRQILNLALPYFDSFNNYKDFAEVIIQNPNVKNGIIKKIKVASEKEASNSSFCYKNIQHLAQDAYAFLFEHNFYVAHQGNLFWRKRGDIFDYVFLQYLADYRFLVVYAGVWHPALMLGDRSSTDPKRWFLEDIPIPTISTTKLITNSEMNGDLNLVFMGGEPLHTSKMLQQQVYESKEFIFEWFESITTLNEVIDVMPSFWKLWFKNKLITDGVI